MNEQWNEIQFLSWEEFSRMAPSILRLEVPRLGRLVHQVDEDLEFRNALVRARFYLKQFIDCVEQSAQQDFTERCTESLVKAMVSLPDGSSQKKEDAAKTLGYIADRLNFVYKRIPLIY